MKNWGLLQWLILIGGILLLILISVVIYVLLTPTAFQPQTTTTTPTIPVTGLPTIPEGRPVFPTDTGIQVPLTEIQTRPTSTVDLIARGSLTQVTNITDYPVDFVSLSSDGNQINYYDPQTSRFYRVDANGVITNISNQLFARVENTVYAPNRNDAILEFPDGSNIAYNFETNKQLTLPSHWEDFDYSPDSKNIAFKSIALDPDERWLAIASSDGSSARKIRPLGNNQDRVDVDWAPNNQIIGTYSKPSGLNTSELFFVGFNNENFPLSKLDGLNFEGKWTPEGDKLLYSVINTASDFNPKLWFVDGTGSSLGQNRQPISLQTWPHKCTFVSNTQAYCGVPQTLPQGAGLIPSVADDIPDNIYKIDLTTGSSTRVAIPNEVLNVKSLMITEDGNSLIVHDGLTDGIKKIRLE